MRSGRKAPVTLNDDDPLWQHHSGKDGHQGQEWVSGDGVRAEAFYASLAEKARFIFDLLIDHPGKQIDADEIRKLRPGDLPSRHSVAASLSGLHPAWAASGRRYPFYWWAGRGKAPTKYAMKPTIAKLFDEARERLRGQ
jgi:hypothetical protein